MSAEQVKQAYSEWQNTEKSFGTRHPRTLYELANYIFALHTSDEECDALIEEFKARLEDYTDWKNRLLPDALAVVALVLYKNNKSKSAYPLITRAAAIADYFSTDKDFDASVVWLVYAYVMRSLELYRQEIPYDKKLYEYYVEKEGESSSKAVSYLMFLDFAHFFCHRYSKARQYSEKALALQKKYHAENTKRTLICLSNHATNLDLTGRREESLWIREEELALSQEVNGARSKKAMEVYERLCSKLSEYASGKLTASKSLLNRSILHHYRLLELKTSVAGPNDPSALQAKRDLIALYENNRQYSRAIVFQKELVNESREQDSPPDFQSNRDRYHLIELYLRVGMVQKSVHLADEMLSELTAGLDSEEVEQNLKSKSPSIDVKGILQLRVFLQKQKKKPCRL